MKRSLLLITLLPLLQGAHVGSAWARENGASPNFEACRGLLNPLSEGLRDTLVARLGFKNDPFRFKASEDYAEIWVGLKESFPLLDDTLTELDSVLRKRKTANADLEEEVLEAVQRVLKEADPDDQEMQGALIALDNLSVARQHAQALEDAREAKANPKAEDKKKPEKPKKGDE